MNSAASAAMRRPPPPIPLTILTGFLGAGKTTCLNQLVQNPALSNTLILINEFGAVGLDHLFIEKVDGDMILMSSGCICCTIRGDLVTTLEDLLKRLDNGRIKTFDRIILETTGLADPAPILHAIMYHPYLMLRYRLDGVITVIDAINGAATFDAHEEAVKQAAVADRLIITKTDMPEGAEKLNGIVTRLKALNPSAQILVSEAGETTIEQLLNCGLYNPDPKPPRVRAWLNAEAVIDAHEHAPHGDHRHTDINRHDDHIRAYCLTSDTPLTPSSFDIFIELLRQTHGPKLLRVKGIVALTDDPRRPVVIHGVQHIFHPPHRLENWPDQDHRTKIVFILKDLDEKFIEGLHAALTSQPAPDQPDASVLINNPLAPKSGGLLG
ncbi:MAG: CobW family GTP-binding protein [Methylocystis sp.]